MKNKKLIVAFLVVFIVQIFLGSMSFALENNIEISAPSAILIESKTGRILYEKNSNEKRYPASTTKIMTALLTLENVEDLQSKATVSYNAVFSVPSGYSVDTLKVGEELSVEELLYALLVKSSNEAANVLAEYVAGNVDSFATMMNTRAAELGCKNTNFVNPNGIQNENHYTTAYELAKITDYALENKTIAKVVSTKFYTININGYPKDLSNTNELLGNLNGVNGVKTGFTNNAGRCLVTSVDRNNFNIITVVLQADTKKFRTQDSIKLIEYIYENYTPVNIKTIVEEKFNEWCNINKKRITVEKAKTSTIDILYNNLQNDIVVVKKRDLDNITIEINSIFNMQAPVEANTIIGTLKVKVKDKIIDTEDVCIKNEILKKDIRDYFIKCIKSINRF